MDEENTGFAARWSKRKIAALGNDQDERQADDNELSDDEHTEPSDQPDTQDNELLSEEDFDDVDFESLDKSSDYTRFIKANVPAAIQQKALRKLWASDPVFEVLDGMNDYDEDFTGNGLAGKAFKTAYKVGKGFLDQDDEVENGEEEEETLVADQALDTKQTEGAVDPLENETEMAEVSEEVIVKDA